MSTDLVAQLRQDAQAQRDSAPKGAALWVADRFEQAADEIERLREAIRRLAEQDATLSVCGGNVKVTMDATFTDDESDLLLWLASAGDEDRITTKSITPAARGTLRGLLERTK